MDKLLPSHGQPPGGDYSMVSDVILLVQHAHVLTQRPSVVQSPDHRSEGSVRGQMTVVVTPVMMRNVVILITHLKEYVSD